MTTIGMNGKQYTRESARVAKQRKWDRLIPRNIGKRRIGILPGSHGLDIPVLTGKGFTDSHKLYMFSESQGDLSWTARKHDIAKLANGAHHVKGRLSETAHTLAKTGIKLDILDFDACGNLGHGGIDSDIIAILESGILAKKSRLAITFSRRDPTLSKHLGFAKPNKYMDSACKKMVAEDNQLKRVAYLIELIQKYVKTVRLVDNHS